MQRATSRTLYLLGLSLFVLVVVAFIIESRHFDPNNQPGPPPMSYSVVTMAGSSVLLVAWALYLIAYMGALVKMAQLGQRGWLLALFASLCFFWPAGVVLLGIYGWIGPTAAPTSSLPQNVQPPVTNRSLSTSLAGSLVKSASRTPSWFASGVKGELASRVDRTVAAALDFALLEAVLQYCGMALNVVGGDTIYVYEYFVTHGSTSLFASTGEVSLFLLIIEAWGATILVTGAAFIFVIWPVQWTRRGQSFGQRVLRIKVVRTDGQRLRFGTALLRSGCMLFLDLLLFGIPIGWLWMFVDPKRQTWHDKVAGTIVIDAT